METIHSNKNKERLTGIFFIAATVAAIIGLKLYDPILRNTNYLVEGSGKSDQIALGAFFELILAASNVGTAVMLYPHLRRFSESWGLGYVCFRLLEVIFILIGMVSVLSILSLSQEYVGMAGQDASSFLRAGNILKGIHTWAFKLGPHFMLGINTFIYSCIFYRSKLVPEKLSVFGMTAAVFIFIASLLEIFGLISHFSVPAVIMALPIAIYEMVLATRLITKGFNPAAYERISNY